MPAPHRSLVVVPRRIVRAPSRFVRSLGADPHLVARVVVAGVLGGTFGAAYLWVQDRIADLAGPGQWHRSQELLVLPLAGLVVALGVHWLGRPVDVELLVDNIHVPTDRSESPARLRSLVPASLVCIGVGGTLGPEAPLVTTTGTLSLRMARRANFSHSDTRIVMLAGMAAGFAVLFGAPLGAALFALEIPHRRGIGYPEAILPATVGALVGFACSTAAGRMGLAPIWEFPAVDTLAWIDLVWAVVAGVLGALIGLVFTFVTKALSRLAHRLPPASRPVVGGVVLGGLVLASPYALTNGELQLDRLTGAVAVGTLLGAAVVKLLAASTSVATGWLGGFIIPLFFVGFCVGRVVGAGLPGAHEWAFVVALMAAANVGVTKTPMGSALVVVEMAGMTVLPSVVIAAIVSLLLTSPVLVIASQRDPIDPYGAAT